MNECPPFDRLGLARLVEVGLQLDPAVELLVGAHDLAQLALPDHGRAGQRRPLANVRRRDRDFVSHDHALAPLLHLLEQIAEVDRVAVDKHPAVHHLAMLHGPRLRGLDPHAVGEADRPGRAAHDLSCLLRADDHSPWPVAHGDSRAVDDSVLGRLLPLLVRLAASAHLWDAMHHGRARIVAHQVTAAQRRGLQLSVHGYKAFTELLPVGKGKSDTYGTVSE